jgi:signal peptidase I
MSNKEPWLAVNLSRILPGLGQIYSGKKQKGYFLVFLTIALNIVCIWLIISPKGNILIGIGCLVSSLIFAFWNLFDAYATAKSNNSQEFEELRKQNKDPWLAMFLSQLFFGIGHFYIGKWLFGILAIILISIFSVLSRWLLPVISAYISYLAYTFSPVHRETSKKLAFIVSLLLVISSLLSIGFAFGLRTYGIEARWIPSGSMEPTIHGTPNQSEADRVFIDKFSYRFQNPKRGDIVVFSPTEELVKEGYNDAFIKRIIGLPNEKLELRNGQIYINNQALAEDKYLSSKQRTEIDVCTSGNQPPYLSKPVTIPPNSYLMLGDNRTQTYDGRCWGVVPRNLIIGKAYKRFFPLNRMGEIE